MGINENRNLFFIRRQDDFLEDVLNSFDWVEAQESNTFEEYVEDILRHSIDSLFGYNNILVTNEEIEELIPTALHILRSKERLYNQIKGFWYRQLDSRVDESKEMVPLKRRHEALLTHILSTYDWLAPNRFKDFDDYLNRVVFSATRDFIAFEIGGDYETNWKLRDKFEPIVMDYIKRNKELYDKIYNYYISEGGWGDPNESSFEKINGLNESKEMLRIKRRMDAVLNYIEASYDWLSPRRFDNFEHFLKRVVFSATRDFVADEMRGEYKNQLDIRDKFEPMVVDYIKRNKELYDKIYNYYMSNI
jgi:hypothetical protein